MNEDLRRAVVCPACGKLTAAGAPRCPFCGHHAPGLLGRSGGLRRFYERLPNFRTLLLVLACGMFAWSYAVAWRQGDGTPPSLLGSGWGATFLRLGAIRAIDVFGSHEIWRLWTYQFLHGGILHLAVNGYALLMLGAAVEGLFGRGRFLFAFSFTGVLAGLASVGWRVHTGETYVSGVGMSGALAGLLGLLLVHGARRKDALGRMLLRQTVNLLVLNGIFYLLLSNLPIDHAAHLGGLAAGCFLGTFLHAADQRYRGDTPRAQLAALFLWTSILGMQTYGLVRGPESTATGLATGHAAAAYSLGLSYSEQLAEGRWFSDKQDKLHVRADLARALTALDEWLDAAELDAEEQKARQRLVLYGEKLVDLMQLVDRPPELAEVARQTHSALEALSAHFELR